MSQYNSKPITQLIPGTAVLATDVYPAVDITDLSQSSSGTTKKYSISQLQRFIVNEFTGSNKETVRAATTGNLTANYQNGTSGVGATLVNAGALGAFTADGQSMVSGERVLVSFQTSSFENGIYVVTDAGDVGTPWVLTRATDFDGSALGEIVQGDFVGVLFGNLYETTFWFVTSTTPVVIGTDPITFQQQIPTTANAWVNQTTTPSIMAVNTGYTSAAGATLIVYVLPTTAAVGDWVEITAKDSGQYAINTGTGVVIDFDNIQTTPGPSTAMASTLATGNNIKLVCIEANLRWTVTSWTGNFFYV